MSDPRNPAELAARLEALERSVAALTDDVNRLRAELNGSAPHSGSDDPQHTARRPLPATRYPLPAHWNTDQVESAVGRYGMLGLATLTGLAAIGTFLGWAITQGLLGPPARVSLGLAVAGALGATGIRLRRRERSFGATLLGLALATTHLCAWAAGPLLGLVPAWVSLALAMGVSIALAAFAQHENDEPLWCVGFGGAAIAPFVANPDDVSATLIASYGLIVMLSACYALAGREWPIANRVFGAVTALFVGALMAMPEREAGPLYAIELPLVVAIGGLLPAARKRRPSTLYPHPPARIRGPLRTLGVFTAAAAVRAAFGTQLPLSATGVAATIAGAGLAWLIVLDFVSDEPAGDLLSGLLPNTSTVAEWLDGGWVPLVFAVALVVAADAGRWTNGALAGGAAVLLLVLAARRQSGPLRDAIAFATTISALAAVVLMAERSNHEMAAGIAGVAVLFFAANRAWPSHSWVWAGGIALVMASVASFILLARRPELAYTPFATRASATAFAVAVCWAIAARIAPHIPIGRDRTIGAASIAAWLWAFAWVNEELAHAYSETVATLLLVTYYASTSVIAVGLGRARSVALLRHAGLLLGLVAAFTAIRGARALEAVWAQIAAYLVTSVFLLGIAWWYRRRDET
jgi:hypothetical protein